MPPDGGGVTDSVGDDPPLDVPPLDVPPLDVPLSDVPLSDVPLSDVPLSDDPPSGDPPLGDPLLDDPPSDVPLLGDPLSDAPLLDAPLLDVPPPGDPPYPGEDPPPDGVVFRSVGVRPLSDGDPSVDESPVSEGSVGPGLVASEPEPGPESGPESEEPDPDPGSESSVPSSAVPPGRSTRRATAAPNCSSVPGPGLDPVTGASPGGNSSPATVTASPLSAMAALASPKVIPRTFGTACRARVSNVVSDSPVVPTSRLMPRSGSSTSTSLIFFSCSGAGSTTTTADLS
jgi:hypothetical protein